MPPGFFCSELSRANGEEIFGTAPVVDTWLLLEHPGGWSAKSLPVDRLPKAVAKHFELLAQKIPRSRRLLIRQRHTHGHELSFFVVRSRETNPTAHVLRLAEYGDLLSTGPAELPQGVPETDPRYLVCTHGKHDKCCAKFGFATYCALRDRAGEAVWQCSHVGGDRFAANVLFLPHGIYYGNVFPADVEALVEAGRQNRISLRHYRGRSCYSRPAQVGEYLIRVRTGITGIDDLIWVDSLALPEGGWRVRFAERFNGAIHHVEFRSEESAFSERLTCHAVEASSVTQYFVIG